MGLQFSHVLAMVMVACQMGCLADSIPPSGECSGTVGQLDLADAIDDNSEFHFVREGTDARGNPDPCSDPSRDILMLTYGDGKFVVDIETAWRKSSLSSDESFAIPPMAEAEYISVFSISHPNDPPTIIDGFMHMSRGADTRMRGDFNAAFDDNSVVTCSFDLPFRDHLNDQKSSFGCPSSGSGGGGGGGGIGGGDWDD